MAWDDGDKNDPWRPKGNEGPADLDAIVADLQRKLKGFFGGKGGGGGGSDQGPNAKIGSGLISLIVVVAIGLWAATGFYVVDAAERGVVLRFGQYTNLTQPGLRWHLPYPLETVEIINRDETLRWSYQGSMLTRDENIVNVDLIVQYRRTDPEAFLFSLRDPEDTLRDVTASAIREVVGKNELDFILTEGRAEVSATTQDLLQTTLDAYGTGITVYEVNLQDANFPAEVEESVQDAIKAREDRERSILAAQSYRNDLLPRARGNAAREIQNAEAYRAQVVANAEGESSRFTQILREYQRAPEVTRERLYLETLENILANSTKVLVDSEGGNNLLYLPLDRLVEQRNAGGNQPRTTQSPLTSTIEPVGSSSDPRLDRARR
ncbi:MAG: FtsH protease activity modulator HflK [Gammaproteobacteria bacterium]|nr:FtsH protease activity modulator HflK [Gammaproteobacteria bacterium]